MYYYLKLLSTVLIVCFLFAGCSTNDSQREFENDAFALPDGFTRTNDRGQVVNDEADPDDWRIGPFFQGLAIVDPPFPNPVLTNGRLTINMQVTGVDAVYGVRVYVLHDFNRPSFIYQDARSPLPPGLISINLNPLDIARIPENPQGLYRLIIADGRDNVITYGDIKIE
ncbi:MAG: hypothetical protein JJU37_01755 [Balneolaceae bacterium]|nr:hypothetical protein [Balneolaceae bacterium]